MSIMIYKGYQGRFEYDADADIFHGEVINLSRRDHLSRAFH